MITAHTAARIQAASQLLIARKIIEEQRSLVCFAIHHLDDFAECTRRIDRLVNHAMQQEVTSEQSLSE